MNKTMQKIVLGVGGAAMGAGVLASILSSWPGGGVTDTPRDVAVAAQATSLLTNYTVTTTNETMTVTTKRDGDACLTTVLTGTESISFFTSGTEGAVKQSKARWKSATNADPEKFAGKWVINSTGKSVACDTKTAYGAIAPSQGLVEDKRTDAKVTYKVQDSYVESVPAAAGMKLTVTLRKTGDPYVSEVVTGGPESQTIKFTEVDTTKLEAVKLDPELTYEAPTPTGAESEAPKK